MRRLALLLALLAGFATSASAQAEVPKLTIAAQTSGTVNWELQTIIRHGFDEANGFELVVIDVAGSPAAQIAFLGGEADAIVSDWIWVARQRAEDRDLAMIPYSKAVGGVMVPADSKVQSLADLKGTQIGIAGGPVDKSWIILRALALKQGFDIAADTTQVFGAPPIIFKAGLDGEVAGVINFWNFMAKQETAGMREVISVDEATRQLGLDPDVPLLGYVVHGEMMREQPQLVAGLAAASRAAKDLLATDDAAWERASATDERRQRGGVRGAARRLARRHSGARPRQRGRGGQAAGGDGRSRRRGACRQGHHPARGRLRPARLLM